MSRSDDAVSSKAVEGRLSRLEALVENNREGIQEVKQSIKDMHTSSIESQKLLVASVEHIKSTIDDLLRVEKSVEDMRLETETRTTVVETRLTKLEALQAKVSGGLVAFICLLNLPWEWLVGVFRAANE